MAAYSMALFAMYLAQYVGLGSVPAFLYAIAILVPLIGNTVFYTLIKTGTNLRFSDPSLTIPQMVYSSFWRG